MRVGNATEEEEEKHPSGTVGASRPPREAAAPHAVRDGCLGLAAKWEEVKQNKQCVIIPPNFQLGNEGEKHLPLIK